MNGVYRLETQGEPETGFKTHYRQRMAGVNAIHLAIIRKKNNVRMLHKITSWFLPPRSRCAGLTSELADIS
jgi:hypothetical protein